jgi:hypothetical protein
VVVDPYDIPHLHLKSLTWSLLACLVFVCDARPTQRLGACDLQYMMPLAYQVSNRDTRRKKHRTRVKAKTLACFDNRK